MLQTLARPRSLLLAGVAGALLAATTAAQSHKINGPLAYSPGALGGDVREARFTPDGSRLVYLADQAAVGDVDLFSVPADGSSPPIDLTQIDPADQGGFHEYEFSPDGAWTVYQMDYGMLLSVPSDGSAAAVELASNVSSFRITPDGTQVCWTAGASTYLRAIDGSSPPELVAEACDCTAHSLQLSPDGEWAVHIGSFRLTPPPPYEFFTGLFSVRLDGSGGFSLVSLDEPEVLQFAVTPDSSRVVFNGEIADDLGGVQSGLFSVPIDGSAAPTRLTDSMEYFQIDPSGGRVVYGSSHTTTGLHSVLVDGSAAPVQLSGPIIPGGHIVPPSFAPPFRITPDGARVIYRADQLVDERFELFSVSVDGGPVTRISGAMPAGADVVDYQLSPQSIGVVFTADRVTDGVIDLFVTPFSGGGVFPLGPSLPAGANVLDFQLSPDDTRVVYRADALGNDVVELFSLPILGGGPSTKLSETPVSGGDVRAREWLVSPDSSRVAYLADQETDEVLELFGAPIAAAGAAVRLNDSLPLGLPVGDVASFAVSPDATWALYVADAGEDDDFELFRAPVAGGGSTKLSGELVNGGDVVDVRVTPDGARVLYRADQDVNNWVKLYSVPIDGSQAPVALSAAGSVFQFETTSDGTRVFFGSSHGGGAWVSVVPVDGGEPPLQLTSPGNIGAGFQLTEDETRVVYRSLGDLYSVPTDASRPPVRLNGRFGPGNSNADSLGVMVGASYGISPDGRRVVYVSDPTIAQRFELFSVPIDGRSAGSTRLTAPFPPGGDVLQFDISPDGERVVYCADQEVDGRYELYSVPVAGNKARRLDDPSTWDRVKLNGALAAGGSVGEGCCFREAFKISPDGAGVAFSAQTIDTSHRDLFLAAIAGGGAPLALTSGAITVGDFRFSPDGARIVYTAVVSGASGLYSAPTDGSEPPIRLFPVPWGQFSISPDGTWVVYRADLDQSGLFELFARPIDGSQSAIQLSGPLVSGGDIGGTNGDWVTPAFLVTPDSSQVLYGADQELDDVYELFASPMPFPRSVGVR